MFLPLTMQFSNLDSTSEEDLLWKEIEIKHAQLNIDQRKWRHFPAVADSDGAVISGAEKVHGTTGYNYKTGDRATWSQSS